MRVRPEHMIPRLLGNQELGPQDVLDSTDVVEVIVRDEYGVDGFELDAERLHVQLERGGRLLLRVLPDVEQDAMLVGLD